MLLRDHPLMSHRGLPSWPPVWSYCGGADDNHPHGEVGILKNVFISSVKSPTRCLLIMEHVAAEYIGDLLISDTAFCSEIYKVLLRHCGQTIRGAVVNRWVKRN